MDVNMLILTASLDLAAAPIFVFQKSYTGNILGIGRNKFLKSYFSRKLPEIRRDEGEGPQAALTLGSHGLPLAHAT
jgi:hypothetical protein